MDPIKAERFYSMALRPNALAAANESLVDVDAEDLVRAHLIGRSQTVTLDKTLAGFVLLGAEADDLWLLDHRDSHAVYYQSHDERGVELRFPSLDSYKQATKAGLDAFATQPTQPVSKRMVRTDELIDRLQWAVWFFSDPMTAWPDQGPVLAQDKAAHWLLEVHSDEWRERFNREKPSFASDPHLAVNWLLLAAVLNERAFVDETIEAGPKSSALFTAFEQIFSKLSLTNTPATLKEMMPSFEQRRARLLAHVGKSTAASEPAAARLTASLILDPKWAVYDRVSHLAGAAKASDRPLDALSHSFAEPAKTLMQAMADALAGKATSAAATAFATQCAETPFTVRDDELIISFFIEVASTIPAALRLKASRNLMRIDPFHPGLNDVLRQSALEMKTPDAEALDKRAVSIERIHPISARLQRTASPENQLTASDAAVHLAEPDRRLLAEFILAKPQLFLESALQDALITAVKIGVADRAEAMTRVFALDFESAKAFKAMRAEVPSPEGALRADLESVIDGLPPIAADAPNASELSFVRKSVVRTLTAWLAS